jgi:gas vesicle protein
MNAKSLIGGILAGAAVGVAIGMLLAPESGNKTQKKLVKGARQLGDSLMDTAEGSIQTLKDRFNRKVDEFARTGKEGIASASEKIKV